VAIDKGKVVVGGIAAGVVMGILEIAMNKFYFGAIMIAEMNTFKTGMGDQMMAGNMWWMPLIMDLITGILITWLYAAIRSRFGPGQKTAIYAAIYFWLVASYFNMGYGAMGMMTWGTWIAYAIAWLVICIVGASVGGRLYSEDGLAA
jgi:hypothetical protein